MRRIGVLVAACMACHGRAEGQHDAAGTYDAAKVADAAPDSPIAGTIRTYSGTRLKAYGLRTSDGAQAVLHWYFDQQRDEDCEPSVWADGNRYCVPRARDPLILVYLDAACSQPIAVNPSTSPSPYLAELRPDPGCNGVASTIVHLYARGNPITVPATVYMTDGSGQCVPISSQQYSSYETLGSEVLPSELVAMPDRMLGTGQVRAIAYETSDGLIAPHAEYDAAAALPCTVSDDSPTSASCRTQAPLAAYSQEASCAVDVVAAPVGCAPTRAYREDTGPTYDVLGPVGPPIYTVVNPTLGCVSVTSQAGIGYYALGATPHLPPSLSRLRDGSTTQRLLPIHYVADQFDVSCATTIGIVPDLYDTIENTECTFEYESTPSGTWRCIPVGGYPNTVFMQLYTDGSCTSPIGIAVQQVGLDQPPPYPAPPSFARSDTRPWQVGRVGAMHTGNLFVLEPGGTCELVTYYEPTDPSFHVFYDTTPVPLTDLASAIIMVLP